MHFGVADYAASCRARTVVIGGLNPDYPGDQWHAALSRMIVACRAYGSGRSTGRSATSRIRTATALAARRAAALGIEGQVGDPPVADRARQRGVQPAAGGGGPGQADSGGAGEAAREGRGAAQLDGRMIDAASARMAQNVVDTAAAIDGRAGAGGRE